MAKGSIAKMNVANILQEAFGSSWIGEVDKKYYVWADDGGEQVQISITLTCPKNMVGAPPPEIGESSVPTENSTPVDIISNAMSFKVTEEEQENIAKLMEKLGLA